MSILRVGASKERGKPKLLSTSTSRIYTGPREGERYRQREMQRDGYPEREGDAGRGSYRER